MRFEYEDYGRISKQNRRTAQAREGEREVHNMFKRVVHEPDTKFLQRRKHTMELQAINRKH